MAFNRAYMEKVHKDCLDLGERKSNDYSSVADGITICGLPGISTRLVDKVLRIKSLTTPGINQQVKDESIRDTLLDVINYATYGVAILDGQWNKVSDLALDDYDISIEGLNNKDGSLKQFKISEVEHYKNDQLAYNKALTMLADKLVKEKPKWKPKSKKKK